MKIRNRLALTYTLLTGCLLAGTFVSVYYFSQRYTENSFYLRLLERANIAAQVLLEKDEVNAALYQEIRKRHLQSLPSEEELIFPIESTPQGQLNQQAIPPEFLAKILAKKKAQMRIDEHFYSGIVYADNEGDHVVMITAQDHFGRAKLKHLRIILLIAFVLSLLITYLLGLYYARQALLPVAQMTQQVRDIHAANLHLRLAAGPAQDELNQLARTFNQTLDRLETAFEIQKNFVNNASHELRNPLTAILGETEVALRRPDRSGEEYVAALRSIEQEAIRLDTLVNGLLKLAQGGIEHDGMLVQQLALQPLIEEVITGINTLNPEARIYFDLDGRAKDQELVGITGNASLMRVALNNVIENACKFSQNLPVYVSLRTGPDQVTILVSDQGVGIPPAEIDRIGHPFFRASNVRGFKGFGMGISLTQKIIKVHGGQFQIRSQATHGTEVLIMLPRQRD